MKKIFFKKEEGFALLFSVLVSSLLLAVGLSIFNIALKELAISTATRNSIIAFYAADSGREQALYNDLKLPDEYKFDVTQDNPMPFYNSENPDPNFVIKLAGDDGPNFEFKVTKSWVDMSKMKIKTEIVSTGWNIQYGDRVERAIEQSYP
jgi:Tfp pilus assembly protein PilX